MLDFWVAWLCSAIALLIVPNFVPPFRRWLDGLQESDWEHRLLLALVFPVAVTRAVALLISDGPKEAGKQFREYVYLVVFGED